MLAPLALNRYSTNTSDGFALFAAVLVQCNGHECIIGQTGEKMDIKIEKVPGGFRVDGFDVKGGKCGCTSVLPCCYSWAKVKRSDNKITFAAKASTPETKENFTWGYTVKKGDFTVEVSFDDAGDKTIYSGFYPPRLEEWIAKGWEVTEKKGARTDGSLWRCAACKWLYKEDREAIKFQDLPVDWICPVCRATKDVFEKIG